MRSTVLSHIEGDCGFPCPTCQVLLDAAVQQADATAFAFLSDAYLAHRLADVAVVGQQHIGPLGHPRLPEQLAPFSLDVHGVRIPCLEMAMQRESANLFWKRNILPLASYWTCTVKLLNNEGQTVRTN